MLHNTLYVDGLAQNCSKSIANALELLQSCSKSSIVKYTVRPAAINATWNYVEKMTYVK